MMDKSLSIFDFFNGKCEDYLEVVNKLSWKNENYNAAWKTVESITESLDDKTDKELESSICTIESVAISTAYQEGFKMAVQLITGCMGGGAASE